MPAPVTKTRVVFYPAGGMNNASARTRVYAYLPYLAACGLKWHMASYTYQKYERLGRKPRGLGRLWLELLPLRNAIAILRAQVVFFQKKAFTARQVRWCKRLGKRVVYDFDDAIFFLAPDHEVHKSPHHIESDREFLPKLKWMLGQADDVFVSGNELARFAAEHARHVSVLPSVLSQVASKPSTARTPAVIGWVGAPENLVYVLGIEATLRRVLDERPQVELWIMTSKVVSVPLQVKHRLIPWSLEAETEIIPQFAVGIAPLADDDWCRAKMNFKALVYMAYGVPAVVSPVGFPMDEFQNSKSVLAAMTEEDWYRRLIEVLDSPVRRDGLAVAGLKVVREKFTAEAQAKRFAEALMPTRG
jgi:glycosyltransferase involved in cell wall biosynthesis